MSVLAPEIEKKFTYGDYCRWPIDERWELVDGLAYNMPPAPSRLHQNLLLKLARVFADFLDDKSCEINIAPFDVRLQDAGKDETFTVVQPDLLVVCDLSKLDDRGCKGAPDLIIEILSPATAARDLKIKRDLYEKHCVLEYWLVHPTDKTIMIYRLGTDGQYAKALVYAEEDVIASQVLEGLEINLVDLFGHLCCRNGSSTIPATTNNPDTRTN